MTIGFLIGCFFFAVLPISLFYGDLLITRGGLLPYELALALVVCYSTILVATKAKHIHIILLDLIVLSYVFFALIPVVLSVESLYVAARDYRHLYFVPLIVYLSLPLLFDDIRQLYYAYLSIIPGFAFVSASIAPEFLMTGSRPRTQSLITVGVLASWLAALPFCVKNIFYENSKLLIYFTSLFMILTMVIASSRAIIFALFISWLITFFIFNKRVYQKIFLLSFVGFLSLLFLSLAIVSEDSLKPNKIHLSDEYKEMRRSVQRLTSVEYYIDDIKDRMSLWQQVFYMGLESPIFGTGAISYRSLTKLNRSTPHNIFLSTFLTSGFTGLLILIILIIVSYTTIFSFSRLEHLQFFSKFLFIALTVLLITGATNDFSGGRSLLFFILLSGIATTKKLLINVQ